MKFETSRFEVGAKVDPGGMVAFDVHRGTRGYLEVRVDAEGYEVVHVDGGDMGRAYEGKPTLKHLSDGRWLVVVEGPDARSVGELLDGFSEEGKLWTPAEGDSGIWPIYGFSGGLAHAWVAYLIYEKKP